MKIDIYKFNNKRYYNIFVDSSYSKGVLHFSHEIDITLDENLNFISAYEIACEDIEYLEDMVNLFEEDHPNLLSEIRREIRRNKW